jgi:hypothetical protein
MVSAHAEMDAWVSSSFKTASFKLSAHKKILRYRLSLSLSADVWLV